MNLIRAIIWFTFIAGFVGLLLSKVMPASAQTVPPPAVTAPAPEGSPRSDFASRLSAAALERTRHVVRYEPAYVRIPYPGGDVSASTGVCTDEVIRSYRALGIDLQKEVHQDMALHFKLYPRTWKQKGPDSNIDHRRVPNLMVFLSRKGEALPVTHDAADYLPGDLVTYDLGGNLPHIALVVDSKAPSGRYPIVHNIGSGPKLEDVLFNWTITGHYRYSGPRQ